MKAKQTLRALRTFSIAAFTSAVLATTATAQIQQNARPPADLKWEQMHVLNFNTTNFPDIGTPEEKTLLSKIWKKEINSPRDPVDGSLMLSTATIGTIQYKGGVVVLTMFNSAFSNCIQPGNGRGMVDMYATCPLRIVRIFEGVQPTAQNLPAKFCMLDIDDSHNPHEKNHDEYAFDARTGIVYLRTIQYGKVVPECNRAIQIFKG